jgi:hypothetical protein
MSGPYRTCHTTRCAIRGTVLVVFWCFGTGIDTVVFPAKGQVFSFSNIASTAECTGGRSSVSGHERNGAFLGQFWFCEDVGCRV